MCWVGFEVQVQGRFQKSTFCISCPASENNSSCQSPSIYPTNIMLVYTIILQHVHMMIIGGGEVVIWSIWYLPAWIWGWDVFKKQLFAFLFWLLRTIHHASLFSYF
jgi:hypothetical protein